MQTTRPHSQRWRSAAAIAGAVLLLVTGMSTGTAVASAKLAAVDPCPAPFPVADLGRGNDGDRIPSSAARHQNRDVSFESIFDFADQLFSTQQNEFEDARITGVEFTACMSDQSRRYSITSVQVRRPDATLAPVSSTTPLRIVAGSRLNLRVALQPYRNLGPTQNVDLSVVVPAGTAGGTGWVDLFGGADGDFEDPGGDDDGPASFDELLASLRGLVPNNAVSAVLNVERETMTGYSLVQSTGRATVDQVVEGFRSFPIEVVPPTANRPAAVDSVTWKSRTSLTSGAATSTFDFGSSTARPVMGDWDGNGSDEIGVYRKGRWLPRTSPTNGPADLDFTFGAFGWRPVVGDWNRDGRGTPGLYRSGRGSTATR
jgi:hypothetical protein